MQKVLASFVICSIMSLQKGTTTNKKSIYKIMQEYIVKVDVNGNKYWYQNGKLHREDGPACEYANGDKEWHQKGELHRLDGAACEYINEHREWWQKGKLHREDGPAVESADGYEEWYQNHELHRLDGPAYEGSNGDKFWYIEGEELTEEEFNNRNKVEVTLEDIAKAMNIDVDVLRIKGMHV